jgi:mono/diheme cytochrome c family protein
MKILKWALLVVVVLALGGLSAFLYYIPPFFTTPPEEFTKQQSDAAPPVSGIADPKERAIAARGREIVLRTGCTGCHSANGPQGPDLTRYLAGSGLKNMSREGTYVSRNLTPDPETGLAKKSDDEIKRVLRSGLFPDGHVVPATTMPWGNFSNWTEEDRHAVVVYLRHIPPVKNKIPDAILTPNDLGPDLVERGYALKDYSVK